MDNSASNGGSDWSGNTTTSDIPYIRAALNQQIEQFAMISDEMRNFSGPTEADATQIRAGLEKSLAQAKSLNPPDVYHAFFEEQLRRHLEPSSFFAQKYSGRYMSSTISLGHVDKWRSQRRMDVMSMKPRKLSAVLS